MCNRRRIEKKLTHFLIACFLLLIADNFTTKDIANRLFISEKTVDNHRYNINKKLGLSGGQNRLLVFAIENKEFLI